VASTFVETTSTTIFPPAHTAVRSATWRSDLLHGAPQRRVSGGDQTELRHIEIDLEGVARERLRVCRPHPEDRVRDARGDHRETRRLRADRIHHRAGYRQEHCQDAENENEAAFHGFHFQRPG
jgi:hypothetical protein